MNKLIQSCKDQDGGSTLQFLHGKLPLLQSIDGTAAIEYAIVEGMLGSAGAKQLHGLTVLPDLPKDGGFHGVQADA